MVKQKRGLSNRLISTSWSDRVFDITNILLMCLALFIFVWPLWFLICASFSEPYAVATGRVLVWPVGFSTKSYEELISYKPIWIGYRNTIFYTVAGTLLNMVMTVLCAYPLSRKDWLPRGFFMKYCLIPMYISGGLIPSYLVNRALGLVDNPLIMIIPGALSFYNALIVRNYFSNSVPDSLYEAAVLDGANALQYLVKVLVPLSKPVLAVVCLYYAVGHWNDYYTALVYISDDNYNPLQLVMRYVVNYATLMAQQMQGGAGGQDLAKMMQERMELAQSLKYSALIAGCLPLLIAYPFVQKYFVKGVMIGAIKG